MKHGGLEGIITLNDLLEENCGEISDAHDAEVHAQLWPPAIALTCWTAASRCATESQVQTQRAESEGTRPWEAF